MQFYDETYFEVQNIIRHKHGPNRTKSYPNDMNKNCLEELPDMTRRT